MGDLVHQHPKPTKPPWPNPVDLSCHLDEIQERDGDVGAAIVRGIAWTRETVRAESCKACAYVWQSVQDELWMYQLGRESGRKEAEDARPIPMILFCPSCGLQHVDTPDPATGWTNPPHRSHLCHGEGCGHVWRPADVATTGVEEIKTEGSADAYAAYNPIRGRTGTAVALGQRTAELAAEREAKSRVVAELRSRAEAAANAANRIEREGELPRGFALAQDGRSSAYLDAANLVERGTP